MPAPQNALELMLNSPVLVASVAGFSSLSTVIFTALLNFYFERKKEASQKLSAAAAAEAKVRAEREFKAVNYNLVKKRLQQSDAICYELLMRFNAHRVFLKQYHNGGHWFSGDSMLKMTCTNEAVRPGVSKLQRDFQSILISADYFKFIDKLSKREFIHTLNTDEIQSAELKAQCSYYGIRESFDHIIKDEFELPLACLSVTFDRKKNLSVEDIAEIKILVTKLKNVLLSGHAYIQQRQPKRQLA